LAVSKPDCTLDTLIEEHGKYLNNITHKGLLGSTKGGREGSLMGQLHELLKVIMSYKEGMVRRFFVATFNGKDALYGYSVAEFGRRQSLDKRAKARTAAVTPTFLNCLAFYCSF
jgi:gamma-tubulin complex component 3